MDSGGTVLCRYYAIHGLTGSVLTGVHDANDRVWHAPMMGKYASAV